MLKIIGTTIGLLINAWLLVTLGIAGYIALLIADALFAIIIIFFKPQKSGD